MSIDSPEVRTTKRVLDHLTRRGSPQHARTRPQGPTVPVANRRYTIAITAQFGARVAHEVTDEAFAASRATGHRKYQALCGCVFVPAAMAAPIGRPCPECLDILSASRRTHHRRDGLLRRLVLAWRSGATAREG